MFTHKWAAYCVLSTLQHWGAAMLPCWLLQGSLLPLHCIGKSTLLCYEAHDRTYLVMLKDCGMQEMCFKHTLRDRITRDCFQVHPMAHTNVSNMKYLADQIEWYALGGIPCPLRSGKVSGVGFIKGPMWFLFQRSSASAFWGHTTTKHCMQQAYPQHGQYIVH